MSLIASRFTLQKESSDRHRLRQSHYSRQSVELYVPNKIGEEFDGDDILSISADQIKGNKNFIHSLKTWGTAMKARSITATGKGIARLVEKIGKDGRVTAEDENLVLETISAQRGWWSTLVLMDTLIITLATAQLVWEHPPDNGHWSPEAGERLLFAYHTLLAVILLYFTVLHLASVLMVAGLSSYLFELKGILVFFVRCHTLLVHVNFTGLVFQLPGCWFVPVIAQTFSHGLKHALPALVCCCLTTVAIMALNYRFVKPLFIRLYNEEYDIGSYADFESDRMEMSDKTESCRS